MRNTRAPKLFRLTRTSHRKIGTLVSSDVLKNAVLRAPVQKIREGDTHVWNSTLQRGLRNQRQSIRLWIRKRSQEDAVDETKDCRVRSYTYSKGENSDGSYARPL